ncbi:MAG: peptidase S41 [Bacteroidetes bacterium]|nr:MAG: peptidase S41 [Bacteroidota bacterium]
MKRLLIILIALFVFQFDSLIAQHNVEPMDQLETTRKASTLLQLINNFYVDTLDMAKLTEKAIVMTLKELDPHSSYISEKNVKKANEPLVGSFEGVGLTFQLFKDTILVIGPIPGGPSDKVGIFAGDKIITVDGEDAFGEDITNQWVMDHLRGKKGTEVTVGIYRKGLDALIDFSIIRDKIPINSLDAAFMLDNETGYIKLNRFARNSQDEFHEAVAKLNAKGMKNLVFDLRNNSGGYLGTAMSISDDFLKSDELIVYTEGIHSPRQDLNATNSGVFEKGKLVVLINEGSASASEIVSGAVQDLDRGLIIGRRSFGKGLVQRPFKLPDGSIVRLTVARYYTPSGRSIQKPYDDGVDEYYKDFAHRMEHGELIHPDSIHFPDSLKFATKNGRVVYGGGGIMPDIFIPWDSTRYNGVFSSLVRKGVFNSFVNEYLNDNRKALNEKYKTFENYNQGFELPERDFDVFIAKAEEKKIDLESEQFIANVGFIKLQIKALLSRNLYETGDYFEVLAPWDREINKALKEIDEGTVFNELE